MNRWNCANYFYKKKFIESYFFYWLPAANMLGASQFSTGCMQWHYAVFLKPICETELIIIFLPV